MLSIRQGVGADAEELLAFDRVAAVDEGRRDYIRRVIAAGECWVAIEGGHIKGYLVLNYSFFEQGFVALLYVAAEGRRQGVGRTLMQHAESICDTPKLFTSTNLSNHPMQALLAHLGYKLSGVVQDLDENDPELIYVKFRVR
jgi:GNAT superfamily N-acetyltransferase